MSIQQVSIFDICSSLISFLNLSIAVSKVLIVFAMSFSNCTFSSDLTCTTTFVFLGVVFRFFASGFVSASSSASDFSSRFSFPFLSSSDCCISPCSSSFSQLVLLSSRFFFLVASLGKLSLCLYYLDLGLV
jgi:hypothetical protein